MQICQKDAYIHPPDVSSMSNHSSDAANMTNKDPLHALKRTGSCSTDTFPQHLHRRRVIWNDETFKQIISVLLQYYNLEKKKKTVVIPTLLVP